MKQGIQTDNSVLLLGAECMAGAQILLQTHMYKAIGSCSQGS